MLPDRVSNPGPLIQWEDIAKLVICTTRCRSTEKTLPELCTGSIAKSLNADIAYSETCTTRLTEKSITEQYPGPELS